MELATGALFSSRSSQCHDVPLERRVRSQLSRVTPDNGARMAAKLAEIEMNTPEDMELAARLTVCKALQDGPKFAKCYAHFIQEWDHQRAVLADRRKPALSLAQAILQEFMREFDELLRVSLEQGLPAIEPCAQHRFRSETVQRPEGVCFENEVWRQGKQRRAFVMSGEFASYLFLVGLAPASFLDDVVQCLVAHAPSTSRHRSLMPDLPPALDTSELHELVEDSSSSLPQVVLLSGGKPLSQPTEVGTVESLQSRLAQELDVEVARIRLIGSSGVPVPPNVLLSELGTAVGPTSSAQRPVLQAVVLPPVPNDLLVECLCSLVGAMVDLPSFTDTTNARFAPITAPLVVPAHVAAFPAEHTLTDERSAARSRLVEHCVSQLRNARDFEIGLGRPALGKRVMFLIDDTIKLVATWQTSSVPDQLQVD